MTSVSPFLFLFFFWGGLLSFFPLHLFCFSSLVLLFLLSHYAHPQLDSLRVPSTHIPQKISLSKEDISKKTFRLSVPAHRIIPGSRWEIDTICSMRHGYNLYIPILLFSDAAVLASSAHEKRLSLCHNMTGLCRPL